AYYVVASATHRRKVNALGDPAGSSSSSYVLGNVARRRRIIATPASVIATPRSTRPHTLPPVKASGAVMPVVVSVAAPALCVAALAWPLVVMLVPSIDEPGVLEPGVVVPGVVVPGVVEPGVVVPGVVVPGVVVPGVVVPGVVEPGVVVPGVVVVVG